MKASIAEMVARQSEKSTAEQEAIAMKIEEIRQAVDAKVEEKVRKILKEEATKRQRKGTPHYNEFFLLNFFQDRLHKNETILPGLFGVASNTIDETIIIINHVRDRTFMFIKTENTLPSMGTHIDINDSALEILDDMVDIGENQDNQAIFDRIKENTILNPNVTGEMVIAVDDFIERVFAKAWELAMAVGWLEDDSGLGKKSITSDILFF